MLTVLPLNKIFLVSILCVFSFIAYIRTIHNLVYLIGMMNFQNLRKVKRKKISDRPTHTGETGSGKGKQKYF